MALSTPHLTAPVECDQVTTYLQSRLRTLNKQEDDTDYKVETATDTSVEIAARVSSLTTRITNLTTLIPTLAVGTEERTDREEELEDITYERARLLRLQRARGPVTLLTREIERAETQARIASLNQSLAEVQARRAQL